MANHLFALLLLVVVSASVLGNPVDNSVSASDESDESLDISESFNLADFLPVVESVDPIIPVNGTAGRIVGGRPASRSQFPWQATLLVNGRFFCGGSLISRSFVLTAAHCTYGARSVTVYLGAHNLLSSSEAGRQVFQSSAIYNHPQYRPQPINRNIDFDIAVIRLNRAATINSYVSAVALAPSSSGLLENTRSRTSGWGRTSDASNAVSPILNYVDLTVISNVVCSRTFGSAINNAKICTSGGRTSTCNGDSGGPLVYQSSQGRWTQIGITSFGSGRGCASGAPAVFTRVSSYRDNFIRQFV